VKLRRLVAIEYLPGEVWEIPTLNLDVESEQEISASIATIAGASYAVDLAAGIPSPKRPAQERVSFALIGDTSAQVNAAADEIRAKLIRYGRVKLWTEGEGDGGPDRRWAWGRISGVPKVAVERWSTHYATVTFSALRLSDWRGEDEIAPDPFPILGVTEITIDNPGTARIYDAVLTLENADVSEPSIENEANLYAAGSSRVGTGEWLRWDAGTPAVLRSLDAGATWVADWQFWARPRGQAHIMIIEPGPQVLRVSGVASGTLRVTAWPAWH
jgi:hypothetical protein